MCGIAGIAFLGTLDHENELLRQKLAWYIITELLITTQARGDDATGIATIFNDGNYIGLKMGVMATEFVARSGGKETDYDGFLNIWKKSMEGPKHRYAKFCMAHCRKTTVGSVFDNDNNHPIHVEPLLGVHNGSITNHDVIFENLKRERKGNVDSEAIFALLHEFTEGGKKEFTKESILEVTKRLHGTYAVVAANSNSPYQIAVFRDGRPLILNIIKPLNIIVLSSEEGLFQTALFRYNKEVQLYDGLYGTKRNWPMILKKDIEVVTLKDDHLSILNLTDVLPQDFKPEDIVPQYAIPRGGKMWEKKTYTAGMYGNETAWNRSKQDHTGGVHTPHNVVSNQHVTVVKKEDSVKDKSKITGFIWIEDSDAYKEITEEQVAELEKIGSVEIIENEGTVVIKDISKKEIPLVEAKEDSFEKTGAKEAVIDEVNYAIKEVVENSSIKTEPSKASNVTDSVIALDLWKDPDSIKKAATYVSKLAMLETEKEIAEIMGLSSVKEVGDLPLVTLVNKIRKITANEAYYDADFKGAKTAHTSTESDQVALANMGINIVNGKKRDTLVRTAKTLLVTLTKAVKEYEDSLLTNKSVGTVNNFIARAVHTSKEELLKEDISTLFSEKDLDTNQILKEVYLTLPSKASANGQ